MNESSTQKSLLILPDLQDPPSAGFFLVSHMPAVIAFIFLCLALSVISAAALIPLDVTIKADVGAIVRCPKKKTSYCARTYVSNEILNKIALGNRASLVVEAERTYRRKALEGVVYRIEKNASISDEALPHAVIIELAGGRPTSEKPSVSALVIVGSESGLQLLTASLPGFIEHF